MYLVFGNEVFETSCNPEFHRDAQLGVADAKADGYVLLHTKPHVCASVHAHGGECVIYPDGKVYTPWSDSYRNPGVPLELERSVSRLF